MTGHWTPKCPVASHLLYRTPINVRIQLSDALPDAGDRWKQRVGMEVFLAAGSLVCRAVKIQCVFGAICNSLVAWGVGHVVEK